MTTLALLNDILTSIDTLKEKLTSNEYLYITSKLQNLYYLLTNTSTRISSSSSEYVPTRNMIWRDNPAYGMTVINDTE